jgi:ribosomal protein S18 acetylase RimI-like enzyme
MNIRRLAPEDATLAVIAIERIKPAFTTKAIVGHFLSRPDHYFLAAVEDDEPVGFALAYELQRIDRSNPMMFLYEIGVSDGHRRQGIAKAMIDFLKHLCKQRNAHKMFVIASTGNEAALRLYDSTLGANVQKTTDVVYTCREYENR